MAKYRIIEIHASDSIHYILKKKILFWWINTYGIRFSTITNAEHWILSRYIHRRIVKEITI